MSIQDNYVLDWSGLAFASKSPINKLDATFVLAPREISETRFIALIKDYLPKNNVVIGISKDAYVLGFEGQPQFRMLKLKSIKNTIDKVNASNSKHKVTVLNYSQREANYILDSLKFSSVVLINGSWQYAFHNSNLYYTLTKKNTPFSYVSPFLNEKEALDYETKINKVIVGEFSKYLASINQKELSETQMMNLASNSARSSFDYNYQTGASLGKRSANKKVKSYKCLTSSFNKVVPFQTYALHYGSLREKNYSPPNDLNYYDTNHAEVEILIGAQKNKLDLSGTTLFINLLPCPTCSRMISDTDIQEIVYNQDHSDGYAVKMLQESGKKVRRLIV